VETVDDVKVCGIECEYILSKPVTPDDAVREALLGRVRDLSDVYSTRIPREENDTLLWNASSSLLVLILIDGQWYGE
jgi:hypothetical protein